MVCSSSYLAHCLSVKSGVRVLIGLVQVVLVKVVLVNAHHGKRLVDERRLDDASSLGALVDNRLVIACGHVAGNLHV